MINKVVLVGRLTSDPEVKQTPSGVSVVSFTVACTRPYQKDGEKITDFINCVAWRGTADFVGKYFAKGNAIGLDGSIQTRKYQDKEGNNRYVVEVMADNVTFVESKSSAEKNANNSAATTTNATQKTQKTNGNSNPASNNSNGASADFEELESDMDLPF